MSIGERIKARRLELGLSVDEVAKRLNRDRATVYRYESNEIENLPISILEPLAEILQTSPAYLMGWEKKTSENQNLSFNYFIERLMFLLGYEVVYDDEDANVWLFGNEGVYEITEAALDDLRSGVKAYLRFKIQELMGASRKISKNQPLKHRNEILNAANEIKGSTEEDKNHDDAIMDSEDF